MIFYNKLQKILIFGIFLISTTTCIPLNEEEKIVPDSSDCVCVLSNLCTDVEMFPSIFKLRFGEDNHQKCENTTQICCKRDMIKTEVPSTKNCGESINIIKSRFETANDSTEYPWTMALFIKINGNLTFLCGASLLGPKVAVTVIHNIPENLEKQFLVLRAGEFDLTNDREWLPHQDRVVSRIVRHPKYNNSTHIYDIALLFWDKPLDMNRGNVNTVCLPNENEIFDNLQCSVTGWGTSNLDPSARISNEMKYLQIKVVEKSECERSINNAANQSNFILDRSFICAGGESGKDTCQGDGGSPLVCKHPGESFYKLAGLVVQGIGCGKPIPAIYANIPYMIKWINAEIAQSEIFKLPS